MPRPKKVVEETTVIPIAQVKLVDVPVVPAEVDIFSIPCNSEARKKYMSVITKYVGHNPTKFAQKKQAFIKHLLSIPDETN